jgi:tetratricopeptide (TPR) repeat protein
MNPGSRRETGLAVGDQLGPYQIEAQLGAGGMGAVYLARDTRLNRKVAIKVLHGKLAEPDRGSIEAQRFRQEARTVSALNHPHIVTLYDIGNDRGVDFLVLEYVAGKTLKQLVPGGGLPLAEVIHYGVQVVQALAAAHAAGIIHRDIKPANIMVTAGSQVKVLDFGLAKAVTVIGPVSETLTLEEAATTPGMIVGTIAYMSPEQTRGEQLDVRSDIFSLGSVLYEAATGLLPFRGRSTLELMHEIAAVDPVAPSALRPDIPLEFDAVIRRALSKDRGSRYPSASEFAEALQQLRAPISIDVAAAVEREPDAFVGRETEIRKLDGALQQAIRGSGRVFFLAGEAGIGKSALASAFLRQARREHQELLAARGSCIEQYGAGEAYLPFLDALAGLMNASGRERVAAVLRRHAPTWCLQFPGVFTESVIEQLQRQAIGATKERMLRECGDALAALAADRPVLLLLEDLHWSDPSSIDLLRHIGSRVTGQRLLLIGTFRPEEEEQRNQPLRNCRREMHARDQCEEISVRRLGLEQIEGYIAARFSPNDFPAEFADLIHRKTEGHPLFCTALLQHLSERGDISKSNGHWRLTCKAAELALDVPESVRGIIRNKIDALEAADRRVLQYASVEGEEFTSVILARLLGTDELALEQRLAHLERAHRLIETRGEEELPDGALAAKYRFAHALYQNVVYEDLLSKQRILLHRQAGEQLVQHYGDQTGLVAAALAIHFERGRDFARAIEYLIRAAEVAVDRYAAAAAEEDYSRALEFVPKLPPAGRAQTELLLLEKRGEVRMALGHLAEAEEDFTMMLEQARVQADAVNECRALNALGNPFLTVQAHRFVGWPSSEDSFAGTLNPEHLQEIGARAKRASELSERTGDPALRAEAMVNLALWHSVLGEPEMAKSLFEAAIPIARSARQHQALLATLTFRGVGHFFQTEYPEAEEVLSEASSLASKLHNGTLLRTALFFLGWTRASLGRISEGVATLNELCEMAERNGDALFQERAQRRIRVIESELLRPQATAPQGLNAAKPGRVGLAYTAIGFSGVRTQAKAAEESLIQGDLEGARQHARELLTNSTRHGPPKYVVTARRILAELAMAGGDWADAETELTAALAVLRDHPAPLVEWRIHAALARLYRLKHESEAARQSSAQAAQIVHQIASNIDDEQLRSRFLSTPAVQEVFQGSEIQL